MIFCTKIQVRNTISTKNEKKKTADCASERSSIANIFRFISIFDARHSRQTDVFDFLKKWNRTDQSSLFEQKIENFQNFGKKWSFWMILKKTQVPSVFKKIENVENTYFERPDSRNLDRKEVVLFPTLFRGGAFFFPDSDRQSTKLLISATHVSRSIAHKLEKFKSLTLP